MNGRPPYPYVDDEQRKVARDAYVSWQGSRYSVPWRYAGKEVWVREQGRDIEVRYGAERIARTRASGKTPSGGHSKRASRGHPARQQANRAKRSFTFNRVLPWWNGVRWLLMRV